LRTIEETLRQTIEKSGASLYAVAKGSGVDYGTLHRFVNKGRNLQLNVVQRLCDYFGLELVNKRGKRK